MDMPDGFDGLCVRDHIPLEQGLRLSADAAGLPALCQRPYSIRTRIKTIDSGLPVSAGEQSETIFH